MQNTHSTKNNVVIGIDASIISRADKDGGNPHCISDEGIGYIIEKNDRKEKIEMTSITLCLLYGLNL